jgi:DNA-directed RNA polymerase sigma subunit (sigma70/sigma32)
MNNLKKISRINYTFQNTARIPEHRILRLASFKRAEDELTENLSRVPSTVELSDHLGWSAPEIKRVRRDIRKELVGSEPISPNAVFEEDSGQQRISFLYHSLQPNEQALFEAVTGYNDHPVLSTKDLKKKFGLSTNQLNYRKKKLMQKVQDLHGD